MHIARLLSIAEQEQIFVYTTYLMGHVRGVYRRTSCGSVILLDKRIPSRKELGCILAEELGHHFTSTYNICNYYSHMDAIRINREERVALIWAANALIPDDDFVDMLLWEQPPTRFEMAEHFFVTERLVEIKFEYLYPKLLAMAPGWQEIAVGDQRTFADKQI